MPVILFLLITVPIIEIALFIQAGSWLGLWPTIFVVIITALVGFFLMRQQGRAIIFEAKVQIERGNMPIESLLSSLCLLVAGAFFVTPGFLTDAVGFMLMIPKIRAYLGKWVLVKLFSDLSFDVAGNAMERNSSKTAPQDMFSDQSRFFTDNDGDVHGKADNNKAEVKIKPNVVDIDYDAS